jgi:MoaD family protein
MITIDVQYLQPLTELFSKRRESIGVEMGATLHQFLEELYATHREKFEKHAINPRSGYMVIMLNGKIVSKKALNVELKDGDSIKMWVPVAGG